MARPTARPSPAGEAVVELHEPRVVRTGGLLRAEVGGHEQRAVGPGAVGLRHQVVCLARRGRLGRARLVGEPEARARQPARSAPAAAATEATRTAPGRRATPAPALPARAVAERRAAVRADAQALDPVAAEAEHRGQQRHRGEHGDDDDDRGGLAEHGDQRHARDGEREQRDDDRAAGERDALPDVAAAWPIASCTLIPSWRAERARVTMNSE